MDYNGPPLEAYSRVTNPERFASLHDAARKLLADLEARYAVRRDDDGMHLPLLRSSQYVGRPFFLKPTNTSCAALSIAFTTFPGLVVAAGWNVLLPFPTCGCDACAESPEAEIERLTQFVGSVVAGDFEEGVKVPLFGSATHTWSISNTLGMQRSAGSVITKSDARALIKRTGARSRRWAAWQLRA